jgi:hypothetical protein
MNKTSEISKQSKHLKLIQTHYNNIKISDMNLKDKFTEFENSKLNESRTLLYEVQKKPNTFKRYSRGQIIKVKFGVNVGSEFSGDHYAIIISKRDTMMNPILHVIPLTSKKHNYNIKVPNILYNEEKINKLKELLETEFDKKNINEIKKIIKYYDDRKNKNSYVCIKHLKTISKLSICNPLNKYDYMDLCQLFRHNFSRFS